MSVPRRGPREITAAGGRPGGAPAARPDARPVSDLVEEGIRTEGYVLVPGVVPPEDCTALAAAVDDAVAADRDWIGDRPEEYGRVLSLVRYGGPFLDLLGRHEVMAPFDRVLGDDCILYTMSTSCLPPGGRPRPPHVDFDQPCGDAVLYVAALLMLDDFTVANGATRVLPGSRGAGPPDPLTFADRSIAVEGTAGSVCWFDPRIWHTSGTNTTGTWRRSILIGMVRRWMKPRFDHPAMLGMSPWGLSDRACRVLGFDSRPPASYEDYYDRVSLGRTRASLGGTSAAATQPTRSSIS